MICSSAARGSDATVPRQCSSTRASSDGHHAPPAGRGLAVVVGISALLQALPGRAGRRACSSSLPAAGGGTGVEGSGHAASLITIAPLTPGLADDEAFADDHVSADHQAPADYDAGSRASTMPDEHASAGWPASRPWSAGMRPGLCWRARSRWPAVALTTPAVTSDWLGAATSVNDFELVPAGVAACHLSTTGWRTRAPARPGDARADPRSAGTS